MPERHDLALMKGGRGYEHDLETIEAMHTNRPLHLDVLVERFEQEMGAVIVDPRRQRENFLVMVERLFPGDVARVEQRLA